MSRADENFKALRQYLKVSTRLRNTGDDPIYYLIFPPEEMLFVKSQLATWKAQLEHDGYKIYEYSLAKAVNEIFKNYEMREVLLDAEKENISNIQDISKIQDIINESLGDILIHDGTLLHKIKDQIAFAEQEEKSLLIITDIEALHPYIRIGALEQKLQGKVKNPLIILYPGIRTGKTTLKFLGIYPDDGNYRSIHIGD